ncbi:FadD32-like long-chain-fatty-acid--AMP ligase [Corynebacterium sp. TA-R-1]|uniref:FadD32-like long-chain-fatty-acid--AMP ligase n=1 Tax=Corynebacterium stercoris TaxID=2943490 RepID=A0ABT1G0I9_9CORY|nr:FadD32-like long-chain-fatty-acid--AMP ligase [Corynebacterium stercoris]MCP1387552.1 FadD32-like long-chain-fatty-acid--AMP ligase [Corynebacterium stercoris]
MDLEVIIQKFLDEQGNVVLPPNFTIPALTEMLYGAAVQMGQADTVNLRFWDYSQDVDGETVEYTRRECNTRFKAVAARLQQVGQPGDRVAILAGNSPEYIFGFMGALYAGQVPVPLYDPNEPGHEHHLRAVLGDSGAKTVLTNKQGAPAVREYFAELPAAERPRILAVDSLPDSLADSWQPIEVPEGTDTSQNVSFLQYTSGSTRNPAGVVLTNESIVTNVLQIYTGIGIQQPMRIPSWLPLHHDMGIILTLVLMILGNELEIFAPRDFIQQPKRWLDRLNRREGDPEDMKIYTAVPNFALELSARYATPENAGDFDFSQVEAVLCGSEPVTESSVETFLGAFGESGMRREVLRPSYGLAEATLIVSTPQTGDRPKFAYFDRAQLAEGKAVEVGEADGVAFASNGQPVKWMHFAIVDTQTRDELPEGSIGEMWVHGKNKAAGYLDREEETRETFENTIGETIQENLPKDGWMNTGDLGTLVDGHLYITGRVKDLVVIAGRNHYPQDIEATVLESSEHVRADSVAAFSVPGEDVERLILLAERADDASEDGDKAAEDAIRAAVTTKHGISPDVIEFYPPNGITRSSAGKIARRVNAKRYMEEHAE